MDNINFLKVIRALRNPGGLREFETVQRNIAHFILLFCFWLNIAVLLVELTCKYWAVARQTALAQLFYCGMIYASAKGYWRWAIWIPLAFSIHIAATGINLMGGDSALWTILILVVVIAQVLMSWRGLAIAIVAS